MSPSIIPVCLSVLIFDLKKINKAEMREKNKSVNLKPVQQC